MFKLILPALFVVFLETAFSKGFSMTIEQAINYFLEYKLITFIAWIVFSYALFNFFECRNEFKHSFGASSETRMVERENGNLEENVVEKAWALGNYQSAKKRYHSSVALLLFASAIILLNYTFL